MTRIISLVRRSYASCVVTTPAGRCGQPLAWLGIVFDDGCCSPIEACEEHIDHVRAMLADPVRCRAILECQRTRDALGDGAPLEGMN